MQPHISDIIDDIKEEKCVLIIGTDIIDYGNKTFFEVMCEELQNDYQHKDLIDDTTRYFLTNEELIQAKDNQKEGRLLSWMEKYYRRQTAFDAPLKKISQIPFNLIISFLLDDRLKRIFTEQNFDFSYDYYPQEEPPRPVEKPIVTKPLLYNLLGDFNNNDAVITFDRLIPVLTGIMGKRELPLHIQDTLKRARTFIFLGVHVEKWYVQLLLRIITDSKNKKEKYSVLKNKINNDTTLFIARRLEVDFLSADPLQFLEEIYSSCKNQNILKKPVNIIKSKIFISYSHNDSTIIPKIEDTLHKGQFEPIIDKNNMKAGFRIDAFIDNISQVDIVLVIISKSSLSSPWVIKEITATLLQKDKPLLPCALDDTLINDDFVQEAGNLVDEQLSRIDEMIRQRGRADFEDLVTERKKWTEYFSGLPKVINELRSRKYHQLRKEFLEKDLDELITEINKLLPAS